VSAFPDPPPVRTWQLGRESWWWIVISLLMIFAGILKTINLLLLFGYVMLGLFGINAWVARSIVRRATGSRVPLSPGFAGRPVVRSIDVTNTGRRPLDVSVSEQSAVHTASFFVPSLAPGETRRVFAEFTSPVRGRYPVSPLVAEAGFPFGILRVAKALAAGDELVLLPAIGTVDPAGMRRWLIRTGAGEANSRRPVHRHSSHHADVRGVRPYRHGDSPRDIHWRTTARRNMLMVREYDSTEPLDLILVVEPWLPGWAGDADRDRLEAALSLAASVFWTWCHREEAPEVTLVLAGPKGEACSGRAVEPFARQALTLLAAADGSPDARAVPDKALRKRSNRCARVLVSSRPATPFAAELRARTGLPFLTLDPVGPIAWYTPPQRPPRPAASTVAG
jgi:uncharacterized protein (DUF58 family)